MAEVGYARASLARIAERAGISKSVISYHFDGKEELLAQVAGEFFDQAWEHMAPRIEAETTAVGRVAAWIIAELEYFAAHRQRFLAPNHRRGGRGDDDAHDLNTHDATRFATAAAPGLLDLFLTHHDSKP